LAVALSRSTIRPLARFHLADPGEESLRPHRSAGQSRLAGPLRLQAGDRDTGFRRGSAEDRIDRRGQPSRHRFLKPVDELGLRPRFRHRQHGRPVPLAREGKRIAERPDDQQPDQHDGKQGRHNGKQPLFAKRPRAPPDVQRYHHCARILNSAVGRPPPVLSSPISATRPPDDTRC
jgi:hypothetical protein